MKYLFSLIALIISLQIFSIFANAQQYEDVVYLKNGSIIHGIIIEQIPGESIKIKTKDDNFFVFKMDEIEKMAKEEIIIKKIDSVKVTKDTVKTKDIKESKTKRDTNASKEKELLADNSVTIQPFGIMTLLTNIEYDRAISRSFSAGLKFSFMTFLLRNVFELDGDGEKTKESIKGWGIGGHIRYYTGGRAVEGFFIGFAAEKLSFGFDEIDNQKTISHTAGLMRLEIEIGNKIKLGSKKSGFTFLWTLGGGIGFLSSSKDIDGTIGLGSIGFGIGYSF